MVTSCKPLSYAGITRFRCKGFPLCEDIFGSIRISVLSNSPRAVLGSYSTAMER